MCWDIVSREQRPVRQCHNWGAREGAERQSALGGGESGATIRGGGRPGPMNIGRIQAVCPVLASVSTVEHSRAVRMFQIQFKGP